MENKLKISIIVPVYNVEKYLTQCLDSLLDQGLSAEEYEIICINDGSKDCSLKILQEYESKHSNIVVIDKENGGVSSARNAGIERAKGEYIWFIDADDWIARKCLGDLVKILKDKSPSWLLVKICLVQEENEYIFSTGMLDELNTGTEFPKSGSIVGTIAKRKIIDDNDIRFRMDFMYGEDSLFQSEFKDCIRRGIEKGELHNIVSYMGQPVYFYRQHNKSVMHNTWEHREEFMKYLLYFAKRNLKQCDMLPDGADKDAVRKAIYDNMFCYMIWYLPGVDYNLKEHLKMLKEERLYPVSAPKKEWLKKEKGVSNYFRRLCFRYKFLYLFYYKIMKKKYQRASTIKKI